MLENVFNLGINRNSKSELKNLNEAIEGIKKRFLYDNFYLAENNYSI